MGLFERIKEGLKKTRGSSGLGALFAGFSKADEEFFEELEETLILADLGAGTASSVIESLRKSIKSGGLKNPAEIKAALSDILAGILSVRDNGLNLGGDVSVVLVTGVNGVGKTTTIGKIAKILVKSDRKVILCAADTFRAAAAEQLEIWALRAGADIVRHGEGADPAAVVFDAVTAAKARGADVVIIDTAGRLHNKQNLMNELKKICRVIDRELPGATRETLLVLDAATGQNGLIQAKQFKEDAGVTGIVLTKIDGTAKGGIVVSVSAETGLPVKFLGVGEGEDDLLPFDAKAFADALLED